MHNSHATLETRVRQVRVELRQLRPHQQALVDNRARGKRGNVEAVAQLGQHTLHPLLNLTAQDVKATLKRIPGFPRGAGKESLANERRTLPRQATDSSLIHGHIAPAQEGEALRGRHFLHLCAAGGARHLRLRQEEHTHCILSRLGQLHPGRRLEELMRNLQQHARAVTGLRVATRGPAVQETLQNADTLFNDAVCCDGLGIDNHADTAGIMFILRIIQARGLRKRNAGTHLNIFWWEVCYTATAPQRAECSTSAPP